MPACTCIQGKLLGSILGLLQFAGQEAFGFVVGLFQHVQESLITFFLWVYVFSGF